MFLKCYFTLIITLITKVIVGVRVKLFDVLTR